MGLVEYSPNHSKKSNTTLHDCQVALAEPSPVARALSLFKTPPVLGDSGAGGSAGAPSSRLAEFFGYKDYSAKSITALKPPEKWACGSKFLRADCSTGLHHFGKKLFCGDEWCIVCGEDGSPSHRRRIARWVPRVTQLAGAGYGVIEWPKAYRPGLRTKKALRRAADSVIDVLAGKHTRSGREGGIFPRGQQRWHWFNDDKPGYRADVFNPHINFLVEGGELSRRELAELKAKLRAATGCPSLIVNYHYGQSPGWIMHKVRYITRATFKNRAWDEAFAAELYNFRNIRWWGKWDSQPVWTLQEAEAEGEDIAGLEAVAKLQSHTCPDCGAPLQPRGVKSRLNRKTGEHDVVYEAGEPSFRYWSRPLPSLLLDASGAVEIGGAGYYRLPGTWCEPEPEPERVSLAELRQVNGARLKKLRAEVVRQRRRANWDNYVEAHRNEYLMSGGGDGADGEEM